MHCIQYTQEDELTREKKERLVQLQAWRTHMVELEKHLCKGYINALIIPLYKYSGVN